MLKVQSFLRSLDSSTALDKLRETFGIEIDRHEDLVLLNYHQFDSPKGTPEVEECRGLVLEYGTWDLVAMPLYRFYNNTEKEAATIPIDGATLVSKLDGSLLTAYHYKNQWRVSTRGKLLADGNVNQNSKTFAELFWSIAPQHLDPEYTYTFELTGPENRVVTPYETNKLYLLTARGRRSGFEVDPSVVDSEACRLEVERPQEYLFNNLDDVHDLLETLGQLEEGFVLVDYNRPIGGHFPRVKIKNPSWLRAHALIGNGMNYRRLLRLWLEGQVDELVAYYPEYKLMIDRLTRAIYTKCNEIDAKFAEIKDLPSRREFALQAKETDYPSILFGLLDKSGDEAFDCLTAFKRTPCGEIPTHTLDRMVNLIDISEESINVVS